TRLAEEHGRRIETRVLEGQAADAILEYVVEAGVDEIVMGSEGRSGVSRMLLGSVAEKVARRSPVPVTIVPSER
ncbi:universal stress protein, partial [Natronococcus sp. A-GB7]|uniref:universal stress protein n=1 Tax=Natronococcus sp. A-GB7 TaxID=3037649 RepID=UPI00241DB369